MLNFIAKLIFMINICKTDSIKSKSAPTIILTSSLHKRLAKVDAFDNLSSKLSHSTNPNTAIKNPIIKADGIQTQVNNVKLINSKDDKNTSKSDTTKSLPNLTSNFLHDTPSSSKYNTFPRLKSNNNDLIGLTNNPEVINSLINSLKECEKELSELKKENNILLENQKENEEKIIDLENKIKKLEFKKYKKRWNIFSR